MLINEKISIIRKMNNLSQEAFAEELGVSRQAVSKWENGNAVPDIGMLTRIADFYNINLDQLVRDEYDLPMAKTIEKIDSDNDIPNKKDFDIAKYLGKICDVSMNSFRYSVIRNVKIVGMCNGMVCFEKNNRYGYFNPAKSLGILIKGEQEYTPQNDILYGKCTAYVNKGSYFGGNTFMFSSIENVTEDSVTIKTGEFVSTVPSDDLSVVIMSNKINQN